MELIRKDETLYIQPECDLIASQVASIRDTILEKLKSETGLSEIVLDVQNTEVVDSLGVNLIIGTYRQCESMSLKFEIINAGEKFIKVSDFFQFNSYFNVRPEKQTK